jgi:WD40 repeat protein
VSPALLALALAAAFEPDPLIAGKPWMLRGHTDTVTAVAISPDGATVASGSRDKSVRLWRVATGEVTKTIPGGQEQLSVLRFSPDGTLLAIGDSGFQVRLVDVASGEVKATFPHPAAVSDLAFSPDGKSLAVCGQNDTAAIYALPDGKRRFEIQGRTASYSSDGKQLLVAGGAGTLSWLDAATGKVKKTVSTVPHLPWAAWSKDGKRVVSWNGNEADVKLWTAAGKADGVLPGPSPTGFEGARFPRVASLALSVDGATVVTACGDGLVRVWDVKAKATKKTFPAGNPSGVALSADGTWVVVADGAAVKLWKLDKP